MIRDERPGEEVEGRAGTGLLGRVPSRVWEVGFWVALVALLWTVDTLVKLAWRERTGYGLDSFRLITEQVTSAIGVLVMIVFVAWVTRRYALERLGAVRFAVMHVVASVIFATGHYLVMGMLRSAVYATREMTWLGFNENFWVNLAFEYGKDIKIYIGVVVILTLYRHYRGVRPASPRRAPSGEHLLVQTGQGEALLPVPDIAYVGAARNYLTIRCDGREYLVRETLARLLAKLPEERFVRVHRSHAVQLDAIKELRNTPGGGQEAVLRDGQRVPIGRSYREALRERLDALSI